MVATFTTNSPDETYMLGTALGKLLGPGDVICLQGELGAGKTCFAQGIAYGLDVSRSVVSPTYTIIHEYRGRVPFYHIDLYRLENPAGFDTLGYEDYLEGEGVCAIEWPEKLGDALPDERLDVRIAICNCSPNAEENSPETCRTIKLVARGRRFESLIKELKTCVRFRH